MPIMNPAKNLDAAVVEEEERILAREAVRLLNRPEELARIGQAAMDRSRYFSIDSYVSQIWQKIEQV